MTTISVLSPEQIKKLGGLSPMMVCGTFDGEEMDPQSFTENKEFVKFLHKTISEKGAKLWSLREDARKRLKGYIYIIDLRTPEGVMGNVPIEDIIGSFRVEDTFLVANSYERNDLYNLFTKDGLMKLPPELSDLLVGELKKLISKQQ